MTELPLARIKDFVKGVTPFGVLPAAELGRVVSAMEIAFFPKGEVVIRAGGPPSEFLYLVHKGSAKVTLPGGRDLEEMLVDLREVGECFGALSLLQGAQALFSVTAREDLIAYLLPAGPFKALVEEHPAFERHFRQSLARNLEAVKGSVDCRLPEAAGVNGEGLNAALMRARVADLMTGEVLSCLPATPISAAAKRMAVRRVGSIVVVEESGHQAGIVTGGDLRDRCLAAGKSSDAPVGEIMSWPVLTISPKAYAFEALLEMSRHGVSHLLVTEDDRIRGIVCDHDLQMLTGGGSPVALVNDIDKVETVAELVALHGKIDRLLHTLLTMSGSARNLTELVTEFNDRVTYKLLQITEAGMEAEGLGRPPVPYCWLALGSEGRREQSLRTDQDNALVFANVPDASKARIKEWFGGFAERVVAGLEACGFPRCPGEVMAVNPRWRNSEEDWRKTFLSWVLDPNPRTLRMATIFFDYREIYSEADLTEQLTARLRAAIEGNRLFLRHLAANALYNRPPLGFLRQFVVEKDGEHKDQLNLKMSGLAPIVDAARVMALDQQISATNTFERLDQVAGRGLLKPGLAADLREAYSFITLLRISRHLEERAAGNQPTNFLDPQTLNSLQRKMLKESFQVISKLQDLLENRYQTRLMR